VAVVSRDFPASTFDWRTAEGGEQRVEAYDLYPECGGENGRVEPLSDFGKDLLLSVCPKDSFIVDAAFVRAERLPSPVRVHIESPAGEHQTLFLRVDRFIGGVENEASLLPILRDLGLPVPEVLAGPIVDPDRENWGPMTVLSALAGKDVLSSVWDAPADQLDTAIDATLEALERVARLTERINETDVGETLERVSLLDELDAIVDRGGPWMEVRVFDQAISALRPIVERISVPLVFSSGDYNPGNLLWDGQRVTGFLDFAWACFEDPQIGYAKYWTYDWFPFNKAGLVERYLARNGLTMAEFAPRLAIRCVWTLQREIPVADVPGQWEHTAYRDRVLGLLGQALDYL
jgi:aminoglycoside phosphotransferase (APT) family kinase protein